MTTPTSLRPSTPADDPHLRAFLEAAGLPSADVETGRQEYLLAEEDGRLVGTVGLERVGEDALIRSLAVAPNRRRQGLAQRLDDAAMALARSHGTRTLYLLTTTAGAYFARRGYERISRTEVPPGVLALAQFKALCPSTAVCMRRSIGRSPIHLTADVLHLRPDVAGAAAPPVASRQRGPPLLHAWLDSSRRTAGTARGRGALLGHAFVIWVACAATIGIGRSIASLETTLVVHALAAPVFAATVSAFYFRRERHAAPLIAASVFLGFIALIDFFLVALAINRNLDMFRSVLGTWLPFALIFAATAATGWSVEAARQRKSRNASYP